MPQGPQRNPHSARCSGLGFTWRGCGLETAALIWLVLRFRPARGASSGLRSTSVGSQMRLMRCFPILCSLPVHLTPCPRGSCPSDTAILHRRRDWQGHRHAGLALRRLTCAWPGRADGDPVGVAGSASCGGRPRYCLLPPPLDLCSRDSLAGAHQTHSLVWPP